VHLQSILIRSTATVAVLLLCLNLYGLTRSLEHSELANDADSAFINDKNVLYSDFLTSYPRGTEEPSEAYVERLQQLVNNTIAHYWHTEKSRGKYHGHVPAWENYWLYLLGFSGLDRFSQYEFFDWRKAMERSIGLCSQHAMAMAAILNSQGIRARVVGLTGHVVTEAEISPEQWWLLDADFGVTLPFDLTEAQARPELILEHYAEIPQKCRPEFGSCASPSDLVNTYVTASDNRRFPVGNGGFSPLGYRLEQATYVLKWGFPVALLLIAMWAMRRTSGR